MGNVFKNVILSEKFDFASTIDKIVVLAEKARKDGLLSLESDLNDIDSVFLRNGVELAINERDTNRLRTFLTMDLNNISTRHVSAQEIILYMAAYAPAFGMLGTVLGLIIMMNKDQKKNYKETDILGGIDNYSSSKASAEIIFSSYFNSYFAGNKYLSLVSARAGNVVGGGDMKENRIVPDIVKSLSKNKSFK